MWRWYSHTFDLGKLGSCIIVTQITERYKNFVISYQKDIFCECYKLLIFCLFIQFSGIEAISGVSLAAFTTLAWMKFIIAEKLNSESLRTDGMYRK